MASPQSQRIRGTLLQIPVGVSIEQARSDWEDGARASPLDPEVVRTAVQVAGLAAEWAAAPAQADDGRAVLLAHGGGFNAGSIATHRAIAGGVAKAAAARVLTVEYRRAPEAPFPAAVDDMVSSYRALLEQGQMPERLALAGDSAGGALVLALLLRLRDAGLPLPRAAVLISPWLDLSLSGPTVQSLAAQDPMVSERALRDAARMYLGNGDPRDPLASPLFADLRGLPPLLVQVGSDEILLSDATRLAERAEAAGVEVRLNVWKGMWHVWHHWAPDLPEGSDAVRQLGGFLRERLAS